MERIVLKLLYLKKKKSKVKKNKWQNQLYPNINSIEKDIIILQSLDQLHTVTKASPLLFLKEQILWIGIENFIKGEAGHFSYQGIKYRY